MGFLSQLFLDLIYPRKCMLCTRLLRRDETDLCRKCRTEAPEYPYGYSNPAPKGKSNLHFLDSFTAVWYYEGNVRKSIHRFKFRKAAHLSAGYGRLIAMQILRYGPEKVDLITWVPVSYQRKRERGYDQAELLAECTAGELGLHAVSTLKKKRHNPAQSGLRTPSERKANVLGAYTVPDPEQIKGKVIILIDDVHTTGATSEECARVLLTAGAKEVHGAAIAAVRP